MFLFKKIWRGKKKNMVTSLWILPLTSGELKLELLFLTQFLSVRIIKKNNNKKLHFTGVFKGLWFILFFCYQSRKICLLLVPLLCFTPNRWYHHGKLILNVSKKGEKKKKKKKKIKHRALVWLPFLSETDPRNIAVSVWHTYSIWSFSYFIFAVILNTFNRQSSESNANVK